MRLVGMVLHAASCSVIEQTVEPVHAEAVVARHSAVVEQAGIEAEEWTVASVTEAADSHTEAVVVLAVAAAVAAEEVHDLAALDP